MLALSRIKLSGMRRRVAVPRAGFGARAGRRPISPAPARAGACARERSGSVVGGAACITGRDAGGRGYREPVASGARWAGLEAGAVAEVAEGAAEGVGEWLGGLVPG